jgi:hypothetical protein
VIFKTTKVATINGLYLHETTDSQKSLFVTAVGDKEIVASAWGPAADGTGEWFASRWLPETAPVRVADRQAAIEYITTVQTAAVTR